MIKMKLATKVIGKVGAKSPAICVGIGIFAIAGGVLMAHRAGRKVEETLDINKEHIDNIKECKEAEEIENEDGEKVPYTEKDYKKDLTKAYCGCAWDFAKLYLPPIVLTTGGILCFVKGYRIIGRRLTRMTAAYECVNQAFNRYRGNVVKFEGSEKDKQYLYGMEKAKDIDIQTVDPETGEVGLSKSPKGKNVEVINDINNIASPYAVLFEDCNGWTADFEYNKMYIQGIEDECNNKLKLHHKLYLIEVYEALGLKHLLSEKALIMAQECGWLDDVGDGFVRVDIIDVPVKCRMKNGKVDPYNKRLLLDFNCSGDILSILKKREYSVK